MLRPSAGVAVSAGPGGYLALDMVRVLGVCLGVRLGAMVLAGNDQFVLGPSLAVRALGRLEIRGGISTEGEPMVGIGLGW